MIDMYGDIIVPHNFKGVSLLEIEHTFDATEKFKDTYPDRWLRAKERYCSLNCLVIKHVELEEECKRNKETISNAYARLDSFQTRLVIGIFIALLVLSFIYGEFFHPDIAEFDKEFYGPSGVPD
jgi:hypothetical protein